MILPAQGAVRLIGAAAVAGMLATSPAVAQNRAVAGNNASAGDVRIAVDLGRTVGPMTPIWAWFGYDEPNYTYQPDGRELLTDLARLSPVPVHVRAHNMLTTHEGNPVALKWGSTNAYTEDANGNPVYDWTTVDRIVDEWVQRGMKPLMEIGFMPKALSTKPEPYRHHWKPGDPYGDVYTGWRYPPKDYKKWEELVYQWVKHSVERYGKQEVESWYWQVWNEPNIAYWYGGVEEYIKLYDHAAAGVKRALPTAKVGGPNTAGTSSRAATAFLRTFLEHARSGKNHATGGKGTPLDFFGFHAKGSPTLTREGHMRMGMGNQLLQIQKGYEILASFPEFKDLPIILGESDPEGCAACPSSIYPEYDYRNGLMFASYTASSFAKIYELTDATGMNFTGATSWAFTFPGQPYFAGFRELATKNGIAKPVLNVFRMFGMMEGNRVAVNNPNSTYKASQVVQQGVRAETEVNALASRKDDAAAVMVWNYHDDDLPFPTRRVSVNVTGLPSGRVLLHHYRIDEQNSNSYARWLEMGAPQQMSREQVAKLRDAGQLAMLESPRWVQSKDGVATIEFELPHHSVSLLRFTW